MSKVKNGQYLIVNREGKVIMYLSNSHEAALADLNTFYKQNKDLRPAAYLVQVQAMLEYPEPTITTIAHEVMT